MPHSSDATVTSLAHSVQDLIDQDWQQEVLAQLPSDYQEQARSMNAFCRVRGVRCVGDLLRAILAYVLCVCSFRQLGAWALLLGLANLSHVAWNKRLQKARTYLLWLLNERLGGSRASQTVPQTRVLLLDATRLKQPGGCGDDWRVHLAYDLLSGQLADVKVHDRHTAEGFTLFDWHPTDMVVADRGYSRRPQLAHVMRTGAHLVVRLAVQQVPLVTRQGEPLDVVAWVQARGEGQWSCPVAFEHDSGCYLGHLIACSLPPDAAERAREKERKRARKQQRQVGEQTLYLCGWLLVFSSVSPQQWTDTQVLDLYRARWQVELVIKRMKQVLKLAQLRGTTAVTNEATILALLLAWSLLQAEIQDARQLLTQAREQVWKQRSSASDPPAQSVTLTEAQVSSWTLTALTVQTLGVLVQGYWTFARLRACWPDLSRYVCSRRQRVHQESRMRAQLLACFEYALPTPSCVFSCSSP